MSESINTVHPESEKDLETLENNGQPVAEEASAPVEEVPAEAVDEVVPPEGATPEAEPEEGSVA